jgi:anti-anti-sigma regulatory factor
MNIPGSDVLSNAAFADHTLIRIDLQDTKMHVSSLCINTLTALDVKSEEKGHQMILLSLKDQNF